MKYFQVLFFCLLSCYSYGQQKNFATKTIKKWSLEKFPIHYYLQPSKGIEEKNTITGKIISYQEYNKLGQATGLTLIMQNNGIYPSSATYTYKGQDVYLIRFFPNSNKAASIINWSYEGLEDGPQVTRTIENGKYIEDIYIYDNGKLISINGVNQ